jgi:DNA-binding MarR family transcriptional regulator
MTIETRKIRDDKGAIRWQKRDFEALKWVGEQYIITYDHLRILLYRMSDKKLTNEIRDRLQGKQKEILTEQTVRKITNRWSNAGLVNKSSSLAGAGFRPWVWATDESLKFLNLDYAEHEVSLMTVPHHWAINEARLILEIDRGNVWTSERELRRFGLDGSKWDGVLPDGIVTNKGKNYAIEVELNRKSRPRYQDIFESHLKKNKLDGVFYLCDQKAFSIVSSVAENSAFSSKITVRLLSEESKKLPDLSEVNR